MSTPRLSPGSLALASLFVLGFTGCSPADEPAPRGRDEVGGSGGQGGSAGTGGGAPGGNAPGGSGGVSGTGASAGSPAAGAGGTAGDGGAAGSGVAGTGVAGAAGAGALGGAAGEAGAAGSGAAGGPAGAGGAAGGTATGFLVEDFEAGTVGQQPPGWDNFIAYQKNGPNPNGQTSALVDSTRVRSGTKAVLFRGGSSPAMIVRALPPNTTRLYVRAFVNMTRQLGMNPGANHETLIGIRGTSGGANDEIRFGEIKGVIGTNEVPSDNISPTMDRWGMGPVVPANTWACLEVAFLGDLAVHELRAWHDGTLVHEITSSGADQWQNGALASPTWMNGRFTEVILGWHSFSSADADIWMDDVILSTSPIGCN